MMFVPCSELIEIDAFKNIRLIGGKNGLDRLVTWVYVPQTPSILEWVHGGEFMFVSKSDDLMQTLQEAIKSNLSGIVFLTNESNQSQCSPKMIELADHAHLPLFEMNYNVKIIDMTREISIFILSKQVEENRLNRFFNILLFFEESNDDQVFEFAESYGINEQDLCFISNLYVKDPSILNSLKKSLQLYLKNYQIEALSIIMNNHLLVLFHPNDLEQGAQMKISIKKIFTLMIDQYQNSSLRIGIGSTKANLIELKKSYSEALKCVNLSNDKTPIIDYDELGFTRLILDNKKNQEYLHYYDLFLKKIVDYDHENESNFLATIESYILNNGNINKTAQQLFVHRNTCIYRINKIQELFHLDIDDPYTRADILNCLCIARYMKI